MKISREIGNVNKFGKIFASYKLNSVSVAQQFSSHLQPGILLCHGLTTAINFAIVFLTQGQNPRNQN